MGKTFVRHGANTLKKKTTKKHTLKEKFGAATNVFKISSFYFQLAVINLKQQGKEAAKTEEDEKTVK